MRQNRRTFARVKRVLTYLFLVTMVMYTFSQVVIIADYLVNIDYISENLCENKDKPELECHGSCHLKKELTKDEERKSGESQTRTNIEIFLFYKDAEIQIVESAFELPLEDEVPNCRYQQKVCTGFKDAVFHPPSMIV